MASAKRKKKSGFMVGPQTREQIEVIAFARRVSLSEVVRQAVEADYARLPKADRDAVIAVRGHRAKQLDEAC